MSEIIKENYRVKNLKDAIWCMEQVADINKEIEEKSKTILETISLLEEKIRKNKEWLKEEIGDLESSKLYFESLLLDHYREEKAKDKKFKLSTPYGNLVVKKLKKWDYVNEEEIKNYLADNDKDLLKVKVEINKVDLKKKFPNGVNPLTGEIIPGINIREEENISITIK